MKYRTFPNSQVRVSEASFGTWTLATGWCGDKTAESNPGVEEDEMAYKGTMERVTT